MTQTLSEFDFLIDLQEEIDDLPSDTCQVKEKFCTVAITHRVAWCQDAYLVCVNAATNILVSMEDHPNGVCTGCQRSIHECWKVHEI